MNAFTMKAGLLKCMNANLQANSLGAINLAPDDRSFDMGLDAVLSFKDKNRPDGIDLHPCSGSPANCDRVRRTCILLLATVTG